MSDDDPVLQVARLLILPGERRWTPSEVYEHSGVDEATARALWRAMGFPQGPDDEPAFTDSDIEALRIATKLFDRAGMTPSVALQQTRTMSQAMARIAESHQDVIRAVAADPDPEKAALDAVSLAQETLPALDHVLVYLYRRHLVAATEQRLQLEAAEGPATITASVGFADLVAFTELSETLSIEDLAEVVERFNSVTADVIATAGARVVKTIGDEVMFTATDPAVASAVGLELSDALPKGELRVGLASGAVLAREGDVFGRPVNLASRLVAIARPGTVLVDQTTRDAVDDDERYECPPIPARRLKGLGTVRAYSLRRNNP